MFILKAVDKITHKTFSIHCGYFRALVNCGVALKSLRTSRMSIKRFLNIKRSRHLTPRIFTGAETVIVDCSWQYIWMKFLLTGIIGVKDKLGDSNVSG